MKGASPQLVYDPSRKTIVLTKLSWEQLTKLIKLFKVSQNDPQIDVKESKNKAGRSPNRIILFKCELLSLIPDHVCIMYSVSNLSIQLHRTEAWTVFLRYTHSRNHQVLSIPTQKSPVSIGLSLTPLPLS